MRVSVRLLAAVFAVATILPCVIVRADDEEKPAAKADKPAEKPAPTEVTTQGAIDVGGQHIAYNAVVGTITVGATDTQDAQLGLDGKPQPGSQLAQLRGQGAEGCVADGAHVLRGLFQEETRRPRTGP